MRDNHLNFVYDKIENLKKMLKADVYTNANLLEHSNVNYTQG